MKLYEFDNAGVFVGEREADICQITGEPIMRVNATTIEPPKVSGDSVAVWMDDKWGVFTPVLPKPPTDEEIRATMVISDLKAIDNLRELGKLNLVLDFMDAEPRDSKILWLWNRSKEFHRLDPTLVDFCTNKLGLDDKGIDNLFL